MSITTDKPRVVVADDSALMRCIVSNLLARGGMEVVGAAKDGDEALAMCEREQPDAMTLDLAMPGLGGIDVLRELRQRGGRQIPVVVVSAFSPAHGARAVDALAEGAFELVPKPNGSGDVDAFEQNLLGKLRLATRIRRLRAPWRRDSVPAPPPAVPSRPMSAPNATFSVPELIVYVPLLGPIVPLPTSRPFVFTVPTDCVNAPLVSLAICMILKSVVPAPLIVYDAMPVPPDPTNSRAPLFVPLCKFQCAPPRMNVSDEPPP